MRLNKCDGCIDFRWFGGSSERERKRAFDLGVRIVTGFVLDALCKEFRLLEDEVAVQQI